MVYGASPKEWAAIPFSYKKVCYAVEIWFGIASMVVVSWLILKTGREAFWDLAIWAAVNFVFQRLLEGPFWKLLPEDFRSSIPYDSAEAAAGKGTTHSYRDLIRRLRERSARKEGERGTGP